MGREEGSNEQNGPELNLEIGGVFLWIMWDIKHFEPEMKWIETKLMMVELIKAFSAQEIIVTMMIPFVF